MIGHELSHVRNYDIRFALLVGVLVGSIALLADFFLRFTFWGGGRRSQRPTIGRRQRPPGDHVRRRDRARRSSPRSPPASSSSRSTASASTSPTRRRSQLTRNPYGLERALAKISEDQEVLEVANRATQHMYFTNPIKKFEERSKRPVLDPPGDARPDQPAPRAHRRAAARRGRGGAARPASTERDGGGRSPRSTSSRAPRSSATGSTRTTRPRRSCGSATTRRRRAGRGDLVGGGRRGPLRRLDRQRPLLGRRRAVAPAVHAAPQGQQLELDQHREGRPADGRGPDAAGRARGVRAADRGEVGRLLVREPPPGGVQPGRGGAPSGRTRRRGPGSSRRPPSYRTAATVVGRQRRSGDETRERRLAELDRGVRGGPDAEAPDAAGTQSGRLAGRVEGPVAVRAILAIADGRPKPGWPSGRDSSVGRARD